MPLAAHRFVAAGHSHAGRGLAGRVAASRGLARWRAVAADRGLAEWFAAWWFDAVVWLARFVPAKLWHAGFHAAVADLAVEWVADRPFSVEWRTAAIRSGGGRESPVGIPR